MTLKDSFQKDHYVYKVAVISTDDQQRIKFLNDLAAMVPVVETDSVPMTALNSKLKVFDQIEGKTEFAPKLAEAFEGFVTNVRDMIYVDGEKNLQAHGTIQNDLFDALKGFNHKIQSMETPLEVTLSGSRHFALCANSRRHHADTVNSGLIKSTYNIMYR